jgi:hypothetical protein
VLTDLCVSDVAAWTARTRRILTRDRDPSDDNPGRKRARNQAPHGFQHRSVIETLFDAMAFFQSLDDRLIGPPGPAMRWAYGQLPDTDPNVEQPNT